MGLRPAGIQIELKSSLSYRVILCLKKLNLNKSSCQGDCTPPRVERKSPSRWYQLSLACGHITLILRALSLSPPPRIEFRTLCMPGECPITEA